MSLQSKLERKYPGDRDFYGNAQSLAYVAFKGDANSGVFGDRTAYNRKITEIKAEFRSDLEFDNGITRQVGGQLVLAISQAKADKLFAMAWDRGHSSGYGEVAQEYEELAELVL